MVKTLLRCFNSFSRVFLELEIACALFTKVDTVADLCEIGWYDELSNERLVLVGVR